MTNYMLHKLKPENLNGNDALVIRTYAGLATKNAEHYDKVGVNVTDKTIERLNTANHVVCRALDNIKG